MLLLALPHPGFALLFFLYFWKKSIEALTFTKLWFQEQRQGYFPARLKLRTTG